MAKWTRKDIKDDAGNKIGRIHRSSSTAAKYGAASTALGIVRAKGFGHRQVVTVGKHTAMVSGVIRRRKAGAKRESLAKVAVLNPLFVPTKQNKSHLFPDILGGPNTQQNMTAEERRVNLSAHKPIENAIDAGVRERMASGDNSPLKRRGSMHVTEEYHPATGVPQSRTYHVHLHAGNGQPESFEQFVFKRF